MLAQSLSLQLLRRLHRSAPSSHHSLYQRPPRARRRPLWLPGSNHRQARRLVGSARGYWTVEHRCPCSALQPAARDCRGSEVFQARRRGQNPCRQRDLRDPDPPHQPARRARQLAGHSASCGNGRDNASTDLASRLSGPLPHSGLSFGIRIQETRLPALSPHPWTTDRHPWRATVARLLSYPKRQ